MSQLSLYLDPATEAKLKAAAKAAGVSVSRWVATLIEQRTAQEWPESARALAGSWRDFPITKPAKGKDVPRESL